MHLVASVRRYVCVFVRAPVSKGFKVLVYVSVIRRHDRIISRMQSIFFIF